MTFLKQPKAKKFIIRSATCEETLKEFHQVEDDMGLKFRLTQRMNIRNKENYVKYKRYFSYFLIFFCV